jgi:hypothetical protein
MKKKLLCVFAKLLFCAPLPLSLYSIFIKYNKNTTVSIIRKMTLFFYPNLGAFTHKNEKTGYTRFFE